VATQIPCSPSLIVQVPSKWAPSAFTTTSPCPVYPPELPSRDIFDPARVPEKFQTTPEPVQTAVTPPLPLVTIVATPGSTVPVEVVDVHCHCPPTSIGFATIGVGVAADAGAGAVAGAGVELDAGGWAAAGGGAGATTNWFGMRPSTSPLGLSAARSRSLIWSGTNVHELAPCVRYNVPSLPWTARKGVGCPPSVPSNSPLGVSAAASDITQLARDQVPGTPALRQVQGSVGSLDYAGRSLLRNGCLREAPEIPSAKSLRKVLERLAYVNSLELPTPDRRLHPNRLRQLAARGAQYAAQPLARFAPDLRHYLLGAYLPDLAASLTDQALDMLDKILDELVRRGKKKQERHFQSNVRDLNANLAVLTTAGDALLIARRDGLDPFDAVFDAVGGESQLAATVESAKKLIRPLDLD
jgi:hypothetical protein